ncbi:hypothetical protein GCM10010182_52930 [Actinomadura cremea]|nr:hypothetical protein GCM10010182_52930 [Actinomadura cremea]
MAEEGAVLSSDQVKHLEFIQAVVTRHANGSFLIKGWTLTLVTALLGLSLNKTDWKLFLSALLPILGFWLLDSYFLRQERLFRRLYDAARVPESTVDLFSMNTAGFSEQVPFPRVAASRTIAGFYGGLASITVAVTVLVR